MTLADFLLQFCFTDLVVKQLESRRGISHQTRRLYRSVDEDEEKPRMTIDELNALWTRFDELHTRDLPSFYQQLDDLLDSLNVFDPEDEESDPVSLDPLEILSRLIPTFDQINTFRHKMARFVYDPASANPETDYNLGLVKHHRSRLLIHEIDQLVGHANFLFWYSKKFLLLSNSSQLTSDDEQRLSDYKKSLFETWVQAISRIEDILRKYQQSDFDLIQFNCQECVDDLTDCLDRLYSAQTKSPSQPIISTSSHCDQLFISALPLFKLCKIFFNKLAKKATNKLPLTFKPRINSSEFNKLADEITELRYLIRDLGRDLMLVEERRYIQHLDGLLWSSQRTADQFHSTCALLSILLIPTTSLPDHCSSEIFIKSLFSVLSDHVTLAVLTFTDAVNRQTEISPVWSGKVEENGSMDQLVVGIGQTPGPLQDLHRTKSCSAPKKQFRPRPLASMIHGWAAYGYLGPWSFGDDLRLLPGRGIVVEYFTTLFDRPTRRADYLGGPAARLRGARQTTGRSNFRTANSDFRNIMQAQAHVVFLVEKVGRMAWELDNSSTNLKEFKLTDCAALSFAIFARCRSGGGRVGKSVQSLLNMPPSLCQGNLLGRLFMANSASSRDISPNSTRRAAPSASCSREVSSGVAARVCEGMGWEGGGKIGCELGEMIGSSTAGTREAQLARQRRNLAHPLGWQGPALKGTKSRQEALIYLTCDETCVPS
ncbi:hypothetical protein PTTG_11687 [Puccinia triticina 1-1 BBBD Race 1]|uniref:Uncharacterized protein n=2 Tax=Puccinia triticina TaxID=208348 RepID=A0A180H0W6_PUCT1|nr:uncharacterized protein PtA15_8A378 [Puccinia triticina]OAV98249.1 hypothetical protein PTTG_11687 [Puccinia triticina 1-1 BBBD Race 1]WAQ87474.1 hypothetical protein PtA15_8A378 [Puccinia triticina]